jgi:hypothetical protein
VIEAVDAFSLVAENGKTIRSALYEKTILDHATSYLLLLEALGASVPIVVALTLTNTRDLTMGVHFHESETRYAIEVDTIFVPESIVTEFSQPATEIFKPLFDRVWNACGYVGSKNFDTEGNWVRR